MRPIDGVGAVLKRGRGIAGLAVLCAAVAILAYLLVRPSAPAVPDFEAIVDVRERKAAFFAFLLGPVDLALVQAAVESGWGRSRFALVGNNLFGTRCLRRGCGLVPTQRSPGEVYEVRRFRSIEEAVAAYMHNLNTHAGYDEFRRLRAPCATIRSP